MLMRMGRDGMSSDESDNKNGVRECSIHILPWHHVDVTTWLHILDALYRHDRLQGGSKGAPAHPRKMGKVLSNRRPVKMLPKSAYSAEYLDGVSPLTIELIGPTNEQFSWQHSAEVVQ